MEAVRDRELPFLEYHLAEEFTLTTGRAAAPVRGRAEWLQITASRYEIAEFAFDALERTTTARSDRALPLSPDRLDGRRASRHRLSDDRRLGRARRPGPARHASRVAVVASPHLYRDLDLVDPASRPWPRARRRRASPSLRGSTRKAREVERAARSRARGRRDEMRLQELAAGSRRSYWNVASKVFAVPVACSGLVDVQRTGSGDSTRMIGVSSSKSFRV